MFKLLFCVLATVCSTFASANCALTLMHGSTHVSHVPTGRIDQKLNELQLPFTSTVDAKSSANELGVECQIGMGFALSVSDVWGIHAAVDRDVLLSSPVPQETSPVDVLRVHVSEDYEMSAQRLSLLKYVDLGYVSPYLRVGVEHVKATHRVSVPIDVGAFTVEERKAKNSPYVGVGVLLFPSSPIGLRCEYQLESTSRHRIATVMIGLYGHFSF